MRVIETLSVWRLSPSVLVRDDDREGDSSDSENGRPGTLRSCESAELMRYYLGDDC